MLRTLNFLLVFSVFIVGLMGCVKNDDPPIYEPYSLNGKWNLQSYGGGFTGQFINYKSDIVTWTFDTINNQVHIKNKRDYFGPVQGLYPYQFKKLGEDEILYLNDSLQGAFYINENELIFNPTGLVATFKR